jgi:hypothetical protein
MPNLLRISLRRFRVSWRSQLAAIVITAAVLAGWLLYWGYAEAMGQSFGARIALPDFPADVILASQDGVFLSSAYGTKVCSYQQLTAGTAYGQLPIAAVTGAILGTPLPSPRDNQIWLPLNLQQHWQIEMGSTFPLRVRQGYSYRIVNAVVAGTYQSFDYDPALFVDARWLTDQGITLHGKELSLFNLNRNNIQQFNRWLNGTGSVEVINGSSIMAEARKIVSGAFSSGGAAVGLLFLFLILGVGTFGLLSYMDSRREMAILKSMGLRPLEVSSLFILEGVIAMVLGYALAFLAVWLVCAYSTLPVMITLPICLRGLAYAAVAYALATALPYILARQASVNELMLSRPVPLFRKSINQLARRHPSLDARLAAGMQCIKLPAQDGIFPGICFRKAGERVKQGETLAWESYAWGMGERSYLAPCDGELMECDLQQGLLVIKPD